jgi:IclR family pca regulon transcriptional regulator
MFDPRRAHTSVVYVYRAEAARIISVPLLMGSALPSYCTSNGRVLLATLEPTALAAFLSQAPFPSRTNKTRISASSLAEEIDAIRTQGWAMTDGELEPGLRSIAVPVPGRRQPAALNLATQSAHRGLDWLMNVALPELQAAAAHLARVVTA